MLTAHRHIAAPALGAAAIVAAVFGLGLGPTVAIAIGVLVWAGAALVLAPARPFAGLFARVGGGLPADELERELEAAAARIAALRAHAATLGGEIGRRLEAIAAAAEGVLDEVVRRAPSRYVEVRPVLTHTLAHVATIADRLVHLRAAGAGDDGFEARARHVLAELEPLMRRRRSRLLAAETMDIDARLTLLEEEVKAGAAQTARPFPERSP